MRTNSVMTVMTIVMGRFLLTYPQCTRYNIFINLLVMYRVFSNSLDNSKYWHVKWTFRPFKIEIFEKLFLVHLYDCVASKSQTNQNGDFDPYAVMYAIYFFFIENCLHWNRAKSLFWKWPLLLSIFPRSFHVIARALTDGWKRQR